METAPAPPDAARRPVALPFRLAVAMALLGLLLLSVTATLGETLATRAPEAALRFAPWNARAAGRLAQRLLVAGDRSPRTLALARRALDRDATEVPAVVTVGALHEAAGQRPRALAALTYAAWLSRRDLATELWWIEDSVARNDIAAALRHYDIALRAIKQAPDVLFPILGGAISQPEVRHALIPILRGGAPWHDPFLSWLISNGVNNRGAADLIEESAGARRLGTAELRARLEQNLIEERDYGTAWRLYRRDSPAAARDRSRDPRFLQAAAGVASPFGWALASEQGAASFGRSTAGAELSFTTAPTSKDLLVKQFQLLPAGLYALRTQASIEEDQAGAPVPYWSLRCVDGRELARRALVTAGGPAIAVPTDCPAQWLVLASDAGDAVQGVSGMVRQVELVPVRAR